MGLIIFKGVYSPTIGVRSFCLRRLMKFKTYSFSSIIILEQNSRWLKTWFLYLYLLRVLSFLWLLLHLIFNVFYFRLWVFKILLFFQVLLLVSVRAVRSLSMMPMAVFLSSMLWFVFGFVITFFRFVPFVSAPPFTGVGVRIIRPWHI